MDGSVSSNSIAIVMKESVATAFAELVNCVRTEGPGPLLGKLSAHLPGAADSWERLLRSLAKEQQPELDFLKDLKRELENAPQVASCLLSREVAVVVVSVLLAAISQLREGLARGMLGPVEPWAPHFQAAAFLLEYCALKNCSVLLSPEVGIALEALLTDCIRALDSLENLSPELLHFAPSLLAAYFTFCQLLEKHSVQATVVRIVTQLHRLDSELNTHPKLQDIARVVIKGIEWRHLGAPEGMSCRLLLFHCLSLEPTKHQYACEELLTEMQWTDSDLVHVNCLLLLLRLQCDAQMLSAGLSRASPLCQLFWKFQREVQRERSVVLPRWVACADFHRFWSVLRRSHPTAADTFFLCPLMDFLEQESVARLRPDAMKFVLKTVLTSAETRYQAAQSMIIKRTIVSNDFIEQLLLSAAYPEELHYLLSRLKKNPSDVNLAELLVRVCQVVAKAVSPPTGTKDSYAYRFSRTVQTDHWNLAAKLHIPSLLDAIFSLGGADIFLYPLDFLSETKDSQRLRLCLLKLMNLSVRTASPHFGELLGLKLEQSSAQLSLSEEEIFNILEMTGRSRTQKMSILLNARLWRQLSDQQYYHYLYPAVVVALSHEENDDLFLQLYDELWSRRAHAELKLKALELLDSLRLKAKLRTADVFPLFLTFTIRNKLDAEKVKPVSDMMVRTIEMLEDSAPVLRLLPDFLARLKGCASRVVCCGVQVLGAALRKQGSVEQKLAPARFLDLLKGVTWELTWELYQTLLHFFSEIPGEGELSADVFRTPQRLSCLLEMLPLCSESDAVRIWSDFETVLRQRAALIAELPASFFAEVVAHFLRRDLRTAVYVSVAKFLTYRSPLSENVPTLRAFSQQFLVSERRLVWLHYGAIVEQVAVLTDSVEGGKIFLAGLLSVLHDAARVHSHILEFGFSTVLKAVEGHIREPDFYVRIEGQECEPGMSTKRALLNLLLQALRESEDGLETLHFLRALDCVLDTARPTLAEGELLESEGFAEVWVLTELMGAILQSSGVKQLSLCSYLVGFAERLPQKLPFAEVGRDFSLVPENSYEMDPLWQPTSFRDMRNELEAMIAEEVAVQLDQLRWRQFQTFLQYNTTRKLRPLRKTSFNVSEKGRGKSQWHAAGLLRLEQNREQTERTQLLYLRYLWKTERKRLTGLYGAWEELQTSTTWKIANFTNSEGLRNRLVLKKSPVELKHTKSFVQPPLLCVTSGGCETSLNSEDQTDCTSEVLESNYDWEELSFACERIWQDGSVAGQLDLTSELLCFSSVSTRTPIPGTDAVCALVGSMQEHTRCSITMERVWRWKEVKEVWRRRFLHRQAALEVFLVNGRSYFFNCYTNESRERVIRAIAKLVPVLSLERSKTPRDAVRKALDDWQQGRISTLTYLWRLNQLGSRTYNDLSQYPVSPWVLRDYSSPVLELGAQQSFRNFECPVGLQTENAKTQVRDHYELMHNSGMAPFHFGSHYSTCGLVSYYLIRLEPFTSVAKDLQDGKFDVADRLFGSIASAWSGCLNNSGDYKELIPEFFGLPEAFLNLNKYPLGKTQDGREVSDVKLPKWSHCGSKPLKSAYHFVSLNRRALETQFVSENLPRWIDLVFGCKQRGSQAVEAMNVFFPYTYEDLFAKEYEKASESDKKSMLQQVAYYGQTPAQVFPTTHPKGPPPSETFAGEPETELFSYAATHSKTVFICETRGSAEGKVVCVGDNRMLRTYTFGGQEVALTSLESETVSARAPLRPQHFAVCGNVLVSCLYSDCSFKTHQLETGQLLQEVSHHIFPVACLASEGDVLLAGSEDCTISVWQFVNERVSAPEAMLFGHRHPLLRMVLDRGNDVVASANMAGTVLLHSLSSRTVLAAVQAHASPHLVLALSKLRVLAVYNRSFEHIDLFTMNGARMDTLALQSGDLVEALLFSKTGHLLYTGGSKTISVFQVFSQRLGGEVIKQVSKTVRSMLFTANDSTLLVALQSNTMIQFGQSKRDKMHSKIKEMGF